MPSGTGGAGAAERRGGEAPVLGHGEAGVQTEGLRDVADPPSRGDGGRGTEQLDNAGAGPQQAEQQADKGGLARAIRIVERTGLAGVRHWLGRDVMDLEVGGVAEDHQQDDRQRDHHRHRAPVPPELPELFGHHRPHAGLHNSTSIELYRC
jgi:hypothetical protein